MRWPWTTGIQGRPGTRAAAPASPTAGTLCRQLRQRPHVQHVAVAHQRHLLVQLHQQHSRAPRARVACAHLENHEIGITGCSTEHSTRSHCKVIFKDQPRNRRLTGPEPSGCRCLQRQANGSRSLAPRLTARLRMNTPQCYESKRRHLVMMPLVMLGIMTATSSQADGASRLSAHSCMPWH